MLHLVVHILINLNLYLLLKVFLRRVTDPNPNIVPYARFRLHNTDPSIAQPDRRRALDRIGDVNGPRKRQLIIFSGVE